MQGSSNSKDIITLPPNVRGKPRGFIELEVTNIKWKNNSPANRFENLDIVAKLIWWGQNKLVAKKLIFNKAKTFESIAKYKILTNCKLFYNYLQNCEPIKILLFTRTSNYNLGVVKAKIPLKIVKGCNSFLTGETIACTEFQKYQIYSEKGEILGEITIKFKMLFYDPISERENIIKNPPIKPDIPDLDKEIEIITSSRSYKEFKDKIKCNAEKETYSSRIVNYLSGRKMSKRDEEQALKEIQRTSPLNDKFLDNLNINIPKSPEIARNIPQSNRINSCHYEPIYNKMDSLYINVKNLKLLPPAIREVNVKSLIKTSFTVECKISPNLLDSDLKRRLNYDVMRFYSNTFDDIEQRIDFNKDAIRSIKLICNGMEGFSMEHSEILFTIWWREYGSRYSRCIGTTKYRFTNLFNRLEKEHEVKLKIRSCTAGVHVADLHCKINLGSDINYIGSEFYGLEKSVKHCHNKVQYDENHWPICYNQTERCQNRTKETPNNENYKTNDQQEHFNTMEEKQTARSSAYLSANSLDPTNQNHIDEKGQDESNIQTDVKENSETYTLLKGLLYVGEMKNVNNVDNSNYFCVARAFWKDDPSSSGFSHDNNFNFMEIFPIISDSKFLERVRNNILIVELWQKSKETHEKLFGVVRLPLHQFFIAFRDPLLANHLCKAKLPVISIDGLTPIVSPLSGIMCGRLQVLLCIGTEEQINNIKQARGFNLDCVFDNNVHISNVARIPIPQYHEVPSNNLLNELTQTQPQNSLMIDVESQTNFRSGDCTNSSFEGGSRNNKEKLSNILGNFLDNLTQTLPTSSSPNLLTLDNNMPEVEKQQNDQHNTLRRTSDLLDMLQKALMQPADSTATTGVPEAVATESSPSKTFKLFLEIECALHLPRNPIKMISKKNNKRNKGKQSRFPPNEEPSAYVTFQAEEGYGQMFKSHEGMVYATNVIEKCSNPSWGKRFEICLSTDYLIKDDYPFMIRVWRKAATDLAHCRLLPTPIEDSIIGVSAVDLTVLMARMPIISGWYNIIDFSGKVNGQIKLNIKPMEDVLKFKVNQQVPKLNSTKISFLNSRQTSNNINLEIDDLGLGIGMDMSLSRAFKRKLVELEEINQRLRARLLDVTGEADPDIDLSEIDDEQMDEFERDLNTECTEDEDGENKKKTDHADSFLWLNDKEFHKGDGDKPDSERCRSKQNQNDSDDSNNPSNQEKIKIISEFLQKTEISNEDNANVKK